MWGVHTFFSSGGLHDDSELVDALLLIVGYGKLKPELEGRQLVCENLHDFVGVIGQLVLGQFQHLILRPVDGNCENPTHPANTSQNPLLAPLLIRELAVATNQMNPAKKIHRTRSLKRK